MNNIEINMQNLQQETFTDPITLYDYRIISKSESETSYSQGMCQILDQEEEEHECILVDRQWYLTKNLQEWFMDSWKMEKTPLIPHKNIPAPKELLEQVKCTHEDYLTQMLEKDISEAHTDEQFQALISKLTKQDLTAENLWLPKIFERIAIIKGNDGLNTFKITSNDGKRQESLLFRAAMLDCVDAIRILHTTGYPFNADQGKVSKRPDGRVESKTSSLYVAAQNNSASAIEEMIKGGYPIKEDKGEVHKNPDGIVESKTSSLYIAVWNNSPSAIKKMIKGGYPIKEDKGAVHINPDGDFREVSSLYFAALDNSANIIEEMIKGGYPIKEDKGAVHINPDGDFREVSSLYVAAKYNSARAIGEMAKGDYPIKEDKGEVRKNPDGSVVRKTSSLYAAAKKNALQAIRMMGGLGYDLDEEIGEASYVTLGSRNLHIRTKRALDVLDRDTEAAEYLRQQGARYGWAGNILEPRTLLPSIRETDRFFR